MALLRRGSSKISDANLDCRLQREKAKTGAVTASLAWNDPSDLDLSADVVLAAGGKTRIYYGNKEAGGGKLDVDMHACDREIVEEPVENIFWKTPPAGTYSIGVHIYCKRGGRASSVPFRAILKREDEDQLSVEGAVGGDKANRMEVFRFTVDEEGAVKMGRLGQAMPAATPAPAPAAAMKAMKAAAKAKAKAKAKAEAKAKAKPMKVSAIATGKKAKEAVFKGLKVKTKGGLRKEDLVKNKDKGKIVSAKRSQAAKESEWIKAVVKAREVKGYTGYKSLKKGGSFYETAKRLQTEAKAGK